MSATRPALRPIVHAGATMALAGACVGAYLVSAQPSAAGASDLPSLALADQTVPLAQLVSADGRGSDDLETFVRGGGQLTAAHDVAEAARASRAQTRAAVEARSLAASRQAAEAALAAQAAEAEQLAQQVQREAALANARTDPRAVARIMVAEMGWNDGQFQCLNKLWQKESNWTYTARNRSSGAYGIPQSLPGSKMASAGADWQTNPATQIRWGLGYIKSRYGSPCGAWAHSVSHNWY